MSTARMRISATDLRRMARHVSPAVAPGGEQLRQQNARRLREAREARDAALAERDEALEERDAARQRHGEALDDILRLQAEVKRLGMLLVDDAATHEQLRTQIDTLQADLAKERASRAVLWEEHCKVRVPMGRKQPAHQAAVSAPADDPEAPPPAEARGPLPRLTPLPPIPRRPLPPPPPEPPAKPAAPPAEDAELRDAREAYAAGLRGRAMAEDLDISVDQAAVYTTRFDAERKAHR